MKPKHRWRNGTPGYALLGLFSELNGNLFGWVGGIKGKYCAYLVTFSPLHECIGKYKLLRDAKRAVEAALEGTT